MLRPVAVALLLLAALAAPHALADDASAVVHLTQDNFDAKAADGYWLVEFFAPWCGHCKKLTPTWEQLASTLSGKYNIAKVDCTSDKDLCTKFGVRGFPTIKLLKDGQDVEKYAGPRTVGGFVDFLKKNGGLSADVQVEGEEAPSAKPAEAKPVVDAAAKEGKNAVVELTNDNFEEKTAKGDWFVKFFAPWCGHCKRMGPEWIHLANELEGKANIAEVDCTANKDPCTKFEVRGYPTIKLLRDGSELAKHAGARDAPSFATFLKSHKVIAEDVTVSPMAGAAPPKENKPAKAEPAAADDGNVQVLTEANFKDSISRDFWFIEFYAPWCGHCKKLAPTWSQLASSLKGKANIAKVDCTAHSSVCSENGVRGYPTIKLFKDGQEVEKYAGGRDLSSLQSYLQKQGATAGAAKADEPVKAGEKAVVQENSVVELTSDNFDATTAEGSWFVKFFAPWCGHCKKLAPTWDELAKNINVKSNSVRIAKVDCTQHKDVCSSKGVRGYPTLTLLHGGEDEAYKGGRDLGSLTKFLEGKNLIGDVKGHDEL